jgi:hypothetical protein
MSALTIDKTESEVIAKQFHNMLSSLIHEDISEIKALYQANKPLLTEEDQAEILIDIFYGCHIDDDITTYWQYMNH